MAVPPVLTPWEWLAVAVITAGIHGVAGGVMWWRRRSRPAA
jgi:hypothetical protein